MKTGHGANGEKQLPHELDSELFYGWRKDAALPAGRFSARTEAVLQFPDPQRGEQQPLGATKCVNGRLQDVFIFFHYPACGL